MLYAFDALKTVAAVHHYRPFHGEFEPMAIVVQDREDHEVPLVLVSLLGSQLQQSVGRTEITGDQNAQFRDWLSREHNSSVPITGST